MASITVNLLAGFKPSSVVKHVLAISSSADRSFAPLRNIFAASKVTEPEWLTAALANLTPLKETANTIDFLLPSAQEGSPFVKFVVAVLPSTYSRGNSPSHSHVVNSVVKANKGPGDVVIVVSPNDATAAFAQACAASRCFPLFNLKSGLSTVVTNVDIVVDSDAVSAAQLSVIRSNVENIRLAQRLVDMPPNLLHVDSYITEARVVAEKLGAEILVIQGKELEEQGFGGLFGVGKASEHPPALVVLSHYPQGTTKDTPSVCLVGKGIVYDTGGLSIKTPTSGMCGMKMDMGGAAAVFAGFLALVAIGAPYQIDCVLCLADNAIGPRAQRNDDIVLMKSGKTVEINNTDAEGRLVLGDGVAHAASELGAAPSVIVDMATLTGAQGIATGKRHAGLYTNSAEWEQRVVAAGLGSGEMVFPLLFAPEFHMAEFNSAVADMRNSVRNRSNAQSSCAAAFVGSHLPEGYKGGHVHIDMAYPAHNGAEGATGWGPALLFSLFSA